MTNQYRVVQWNRHKRVYDLLIALFVGLYLVIFVGAGMLLFPPPGEIAPPVLLIRALGTCAIVLLHLILVIGPLARITPKAAPLLYNRRHLGVTVFMLASLHALLAVGFYGGFGVRNPLLAVLAPGGAASFEFLGFLALIVFAFMAVTSHDFWLANLGDAWWKALHMLVYAAYALVVAHVVLGALRDQTSVVPLALLGAGCVLVVTLHLRAGGREFERDRPAGRFKAPSVEGDARWVDACGIDEIRPGRARVVQIGNAERIAVFRHNDTVSAVTNVCAHQGGPLGEGKVIDGCITCPWHGYQYDPASGCSPPPYTEKIATYPVLIRGRRVLIDPTPNPPGTRVEPAPIDPEPNAEGAP